MQFNNYLKRKMPFLALLASLFGLSSCGSYQYVGVDNDGIYGASEKPVQKEEAVTVAHNNSQNNYYKNYFKTKSLEYENITDDVVFTDIDSYVGNDYVENDSINNNNYQGYAGWGQDNNDVTIYVYPSYGYNFWWHRPLYNNWGYYGWNNWGYYDSFWCPPFYGGGFFDGYYNSWAFNPYRYGYGYYGNNRYYNSRGIVYNASRRGSLANRSNSLTSINSRYYASRRGNNTSRINRNNATNSRFGTNVVRRRSTAYPSRNSTTRATSPAVRRSRSTSTRSSNNSYNSSRSRRSSSSTTRSSSSNRSYGSSTRSSSSSRGSSSSGSSRGSGRRR